MVVLFAFPSLAPGTEAEDRLEGNLDIGYRNADVNGNLNKYREDVNLSDDAFRLFDLELEYRPEAATWFDQVILEARGVGGEPYTSARFGLRKSGRYDLGLRYRSSEFFYHDDGYFFRTAGDLHTWDARRSFLDFDLKLDLSDRVRLRFGADRGERDGSSTSSRDVQREVFQLNRPVDQDSSDYWAGIDVRVGWGDLTVEQRFTSFENRWVLSTFNSDGEESGGACLDDKVQDRVEDGEAPISRISFTGGPDDRIRFAVGYTRIDADLDFQVDGAWEGLDYDDPVLGPPEPFRTTLTNRGQVDRDSDLWNADVTFGLNDSLDLTLDFARRSYDQDGTLDFVEEQIGGKDAGLFVVQGDVRNQLDLDTYGLILDWRLTRTLAVAAGAGLQQRTKDFQLSGPELETERRIYRAAVRWRPNAIWNLRLDFEQGDEDDPLTPVSATTADRLRFFANLRPVEKLAVSFRFSDDSKENDLSYPLGMPSGQVRRHNLVGRRELERRAVRSGRGLLQLGDRLRRAHRVRHRLHLRPGLRHLHDPGEHRLHR
jgi:hypothetical protein